WTQVTPHPRMVSAAAQARVDAVNWEIINVAPTKPQVSTTQSILACSDHNYDALPFDALLLLPPSSSQTLPPLVVIPHGGPHGAFTTSYVPGHAFFASLGMAVLQINYRGSTGYGQDALKSLPGKCGIQDVHDCMEAIKAVT